MRHPFSDVDEDCRSSEAVTQGYALHHGKYYLLHSTYSSVMSTARASCQEAGGDLAVMKTEEDRLGIREAIGE